MTATFRNSLFLALCLTVLYANDLVAQISPTSLNWSDFKGQVDNSSPYYAMTNWGVNYNYTVSFESEIAIPKLKTEYYLKESSWVKRQLSSERLLNHERGHFKLAELLSLEFSYEVSHTAFLRTNYKYKIDSLFKTILKKYQDMEIEYDTETKHMNDEQAQQKWDEFLNNRKRYFDSINN